MKMYFLVFVKNTHKNTDYIIICKEILTDEITPWKKEIHNFWMWVLHYYFAYTGIQAESCRISLTVHWWLNCPLATIVQNNDYKLFSITIFLMERQALLQLVFLVNTFTVSCLRPGCSQMR